MSFIIDLKRNKKYLNDDQINNYYVCQKVCKNLLDKTKVNVNVDGLSNIPEEGPTLITSNHQNFFDIILLSSIIDRPMPFAAAVELMKYPILRDYIKGIEMENVISNNGLILFPEGECNYISDEVKDFKKGGFASVKKNGCKIVPTYIKYGKLKKSLGKWYVPVEDVSISFGNSFTSMDVNNNRVTPQELATITREKVLSLKM